MFSRREQSLALVACLASSCTIETGPDVDMARCLPSPSYFASDVWPRFLDEGRCGRAECHSTATTGRGYFRLSASPGSVPTASSIEAWSAAWRDNYRAAVQQVRCDDVLQSRLLLLPTSRAEAHPGGVIITNMKAADQLFLDWIQAP